MLQFVVFLCKKGFLFFNLSGIDQFIREKKKKKILVVLVICRLRENGLLSILSPAGDVKFVLTE